MSVSTTSSISDVLLSTSGRNIGGLIPNVTIEEDHADSLTITKHPVQLGATISDHAYINPQQLVMKVGWSNSSKVQTALNAGGVFTQPISSVSDLYQAALALQASRTLLTVVTGKRIYYNMLIAKLETTTNEDTENSLILIVTLEQLILVTIGGSNAQSSQLGTAVNQKYPQSTAVAVLSGIQQAISAKQSVVSGLASGFPGLPSSLSSLAISIGSLTARVPGVSKSSISLLLGRTLPGITAAAIPNIAASFPSLLPGISVPGLTTLLASPAPTVPGIVNQLPNIPGITGASVSNVFNSLATL